MMVADPQHKAQVGLGVLRDTRAQLFSRLSDSDNKTSLDISITSSLSPLLAYDNVEC